MPESVVLLHGFGGTRRTWDGVIGCLPRERYMPLALDLPGHGAHARCTEPVTFAACVRAVLAQSPARFVLCGYSLGGRIALHVALAAPERVRRLMLVSASAGIEDARERERRRLADGALAKQLERDAFEGFIARWSEQPLFAADPPQVSRLARADQRRNRPRALAAVLRGVGAGQMAPLWGELERLRMPTEVLAGERDAAYRAIGRRMVSLLPRGRMMVVRGGHRLALENPSALVRALQGLDPETGG